VLVLGLVLAACSRSRAPEPEPAPVPPQASGTLPVGGIGAPVSIVRDRWGIPHITAASADDLFFAQGFVQAQDRLFQMDLWRRASQGRLSETLAANFLERDAMTRRMQYRGDLDREWASYGADTRAIAVAFTRGINAWVERARRDVPEEFRLAGWLPEYWRPEDLLNRTDAFLASGSAVDDLLRARLAGAIGTNATAALFPEAGIDGRNAAPPGIDLSVITYAVPETLRRVGTPAFFVTLAGPVTRAPRASGSNAWAVGGPAPLVAVDPHRPLSNPSLRYLVHLTAPGWNVAGATAPWLPGVAIGHNDRISWGMTAAGLDTQDVYVERVNPADPHQVERDGRWVDMTIDNERLEVKGRAAPFTYERMYTANGAVFALDRQRHLAYSLRWSGSEPGAASELAALAIDRASSLDEFEAALTRWKMPAADFVYADREGHVAKQTAGLVPIRAGDTGAMPLPGWTSATAWRGWQERPGTLLVDPPTGRVVAANGDPARLNRIDQLLSSPDGRSRSAVERAQQDVVAWNASQLLPLLRAVRDVPADAEPVRQQLLAWDGRVDAASEAAAVYVAWEQALARRLAERRVPPEYAADVAAHVDPVAALTRPSSRWFEGDASRARDRLLVDALGPAGEAARQNAADAGKRRSEVVFAHPLGVFEDARRRFNVGPFPLPGYPHTVFATDGRNGPAFRAVFDVADWDRSEVVNAPGQSGSPASAHYDDMATVWARGAYVPLVFSPDAVRAAAAETLTLTPR
jgi:penicillin amidase